jgi:hypothetical protein
LLCGEGLVGARIRRLLRDHDVVPSHHAWRRRRSFEPRERTFVCVSLCARHRELGLRRVQFRLRFRPLRHEFGRFKYDQDLSVADFGPPVHVYGLHKSGDSRKHRYRLKRRQLAGQGQRHIERLLDDPDNIDRRRACRADRGGARSAAAPSARRGSE